MHLLTKTVIRNCFDFKKIQKLSKLLLLGILLCFAILVTSNSQDLGNGFYDHGVASPFSNQRGIVATVDGNGRDVALVWLFDHQGCYALLMIDAETGKTDQFKMPFTSGDAIFSSILSSKNKFYTLLGSHFLEFDPVKRAFTFSKETEPAMAMGMTEDDKGLIWAATYPNSGLVSFNPETREFWDYGYLYKQNWPQYQPFVAADKEGWIYFGVGLTASQIIAFNPADRKVKPMLKEEDRKKGDAYVYRDLDGKVYGQSLKKDEEPWYEFYNGKGHKIGNHTSLNPKPIITGNQTLFYHDLPDGKRILYVGMVERKLYVIDSKTNKEKVVSFDYSTDGAIIMGVTSTDSSIIGGTTFPMRLFSYNPKTDKIVNNEAFGQFNALASQGDYLYFGAYPQGALLEWNPSKPWINTKEGKDTNPSIIARSDLSTHRPVRILAYPDGKTIIMSGTPDYGYTGGGMLFWDQDKKTQMLLKDSAIIVDQTALSLVVLGGGKILGGTTTTPGTGGEKKANVAELFIMDMATKKIIWHNAILKGVQSYYDMSMGSDGLIYGMADAITFFVFDPVKKIIVHQEDTKTRFEGSVTNQSPRVFVKGPKGELYMLFKTGIVRIEYGSFKLTMIAKSPVPIDTGGAYLDGQIYFASGSHFYSYKLKF